MNLFVRMVILTILLASQAVLAEPYRRLVNFEWEAIEGAKSYEIQLEQAKENGKTFTFKVKDAAWNGHLTPGLYMMKLRSRDYRNVPGEWSEPSEFKVGLESALLKSPAANSQVQSKDTDLTEMEFSWAPVHGAKTYQFELISADEKMKMTEVLSEPSFKAKLPVAMAYTWKVSATNEEGVLSEATSVGQFTILGHTLESPKIETPETEFVRELKWDRPDKTAQYDIYILKLNETTRKWEKFQVYENFQQDILPFDESWPGGQYEVAVRSKAELRPRSPLARQKFKVRHGNRSPAAEYTALVRKSIDRVTGWYGIASYLVTELAYSGKNPEKNSTVAYKALGGTGRAGLGWFDANSAWGFLGILDMSGFTFNGKTQTFASAEANAIYRTQVGERGEARFQFGPYYKELPETIGDPFTGSSQGYTISSAGPHAGVEYWYSLTPKFGIQANAHMYMSLMKINTPNGQDMSPTLSTQFGFLGSYRFTPKFTGLIGYALREDRVSYNAVPSSSNFAVAGDVNESTVVGNYLNIFAEWSF